MDTVTKTATTGQPATDRREAFPLYIPGDQFGGTRPEYYCGMELRDWFAGHALAGLLARESGGFIQSHSIQSNAEDAYLMADAMMAERRK